MKIVFFNSSTLNYGGGCEISFMRLGRWLSERGHEIYYVTGSSDFCNSYCRIMGSEHKKNLSDEYLNKNFKVTNYITYDYKDLIFKTKKREKINKILEESKIIITKNEILPIAILKFINAPDRIAIIFHTPIIYPKAKKTKAIFHNVIYGSFLYKRAIKKYSLIALTKDSEKILKKMIKDDITIFPNSIDIKKFRAKKFRKGKKFKIYYIGRMVEDKGIDILYKTVKLLSKTNIFKSIEFYFVGEGDKEHYLKELSNKYKNCNFLGFKDDIVKCYHNADLIVVPSRWESFCYSVAEAQSCGIPVISSNIPGPKSIIINNKTGFLIHMTHKNFVKCILKAFYLWKDKFPKFVKMGKEGRKNILSNFHQDKINLNIEKLINNMETKNEEY